MFFASFVRGGVTQLCRRVSCGYGRTTPVSIEGVRTAVRFSAARYGRLVSRIRRSRPFGRAGRRAGFVRSRRYVSSGRLAQALPRDGPKVRLAGMAFRGVVRSRSAGGVPSGRSRRSCGADSGGRLLASDRNAAGRQPSVRGSLRGFPNYFRPALSYSDKNDYFCEQQKSAFLCHSSMKGCSPKDLPSTMCCSFPPIRKCCRERSALGPVSREISSSTSPSCPPLWTP